MAFVNRVLLIGNLTRDPTLSYLPSSNAVCEFSLAINRRWKDQQGQQRDEACFVDCRAYGQTGELISKHLTKGRQLFVEGRLKQDTWTAQDGGKRSKLLVVVDNFQFLNDRPPGSSSEHAPVSGGHQRPSREPGPGGPPSRPYSGQSRYAHDAAAVPPTVESADPIHDQPRPPGYDEEGPPPSQDEDIPF